MGFWTLLAAASMPVLQVLLISIFGVVLASEYLNILHADARKYMNKSRWSSFFTPCLMFASLSKTVTWEDIISWWYMPVNIGLTFVFGGLLGWIVVKILKPEKHLEGLVIAICSAGNLGNLMFILIPAICDENSSPFGKSSTCKDRGTAYASFSKATGAFYLWTYTYHLIKGAGEIYHQRELTIDEPSKVPNSEVNSGLEDQLLMAESGEKGEDHVAITFPITSKIIDDRYANQEDDVHSKTKVGFWSNLKNILHQIVHEILAPPTIAAIWGFIFGSIPWLKSLIIGSSAPLRVAQDSIQLLGDGTIPCITLILGGNLTQGLRSGKLRPLVIISVILVRYVLLPPIGVAVVKLAAHLGFLPQDPLYQFVLMVQFTLPPAMNIGTMAELFDVGQDDCSVLFLWTYLVAAFALTIWSTVFMYVLS